MHTGQRCVGNALSVELLKDETKCVRDAHFCLMHAWMLTHWEVASGFIHDSLVASLHRLSVERADTPKDHVA